jgi:glycosyltransferase involved in cell wall biosynthesis
MTKQVLFVTHSWPPDACVGAVRPLNIVRAIKPLGWQATILTIQAKYYRYRQQKGCDESALAAVVRTRCLPHPLDLYRMIKEKLLNRTAPSKQMSAGSEAQATSTVRAGDPSRSKPSWLQRVRRVVLSMLHTPDEQLGWLPFAAWEGIRLVRKHHIPCMITTGPPFTAHLIGLFIKRLTSVRWIVEFRDPWVGNLQKEPSTQSEVADRCDRWLEALVVRQANHVLCVTESMSRVYRGRYQDEPEKKWLTVPNGYDTGEFSSLGSVPMAQRFTITYVGGFNYSRSPKTLLLALQRLVSEHLIEAAALRVRFIGVCRFASGRPVQEMISETGLSEVVEIVDLLPRQDALRAMLEAHVLLLLANEQPLQIPGKAYEYLAAGRPILTETEEKSATADLIRDSGCGDVIEPGDVAHMARCVARAFDAYRTGTSTIGQEGLARRQAYAWDTLGSQYATVLNSLRQDPTR